MSLGWLMVPWMVDGSLDGDGSLAGDGSLNGAGLLWGRSLFSGEWGGKGIAAWVGLSFVLWETDGFFKPHAKGTSQGGAIMGHIKEKNL